MDACEQLRGAYAMLDAMGIDWFAERARHELVAVGQTVRKRKAQAEELTAINSAMQRFGLHGYAGRMAREFGDHPDTAARRMRWVRHLIQAADGLSGS